MFQDFCKSLISFWSSLQYKFLSFFTRHISPIFLQFWIIFDLDRNHLASLSFLKLLFSLWIKPEVILILSGQINFTYMHQFKNKILWFTLLGFCHQSNRCISCRFNAYITVWSKEISSHKMFQFYFPSVYIRGVFKKKQYPSGMYQFINLQSMRR